MVICQKRISKNAWWLQSNFAWQFFTFIQQNLGLECDKPAYNQNNILLSYLSPDPKVKTLLLNQKLRKMFSLYFHYSLVLGRLEFMYILKGNKNRYILFMIFLKTVNTNHASVILWLMHNSSYQIHNGIALIKNALSLSIIGCFSIIILLL